MLLPHEPGQTFVSKEWSERGATWLLVISHKGQSSICPHALGGQPACYAEGQAHEDVTWECPSRQPPALAHSSRGCRQHGVETRHTPVPRPNSNPQKPWAIINEYWNLKLLVFRVILLCSCRCSCIVFPLVPKPGDGPSPSPEGIRVTLQRENQKGYGLEIPGTGKVRGYTFLKIGLCGKEQDPAPFLNSVPRMLTARLVPFQAGDWRRAVWGSEHKKNGHILCLKSLRETAHPHPISQQAPPHTELLKSSSSLTLTYEQIG